MPPCPGSMIIVRILGTLLRVGCLVKELIENSSTEAIKYATIFFLILFFVLMGVISNLHKFLYRERLFLYHRNL